MHTYNLFAVKVRSIQGDIAKIRYLARWGLQDTPCSLEAKNAYKGWFSRTRAILTQLEKAENELTLYEAVAYQQQIIAHLKKIGRKKTKMHQDKCKILQSILSSLNDVIDVKKREIVTIINVLRSTIEANKQHFTAKEIKEFNKTIRRFNKIITQKYSNIRLYLHKIKTTIELFLSFFRKKLRLFSPEHRTLFKSSINQLMFVLEDKLQLDCMKLLNEIKTVINSNHDHKAFIAFTQGHKNLLNITPANPERSYQLYLLLKLFMTELKQYVQTDKTREFKKSFRKQYYLLNTKFEKLKKNNLYYLDDTNFNEEDDSRYILTGVKTAHAPPREGNEIIHFLNSYEDLYAPQTELRGAFPAMIRSIQEAKYLICISGWEINLHLDYLQPTLNSYEEHEQSPYTLGKILVQKAIDNPNVTIAIKVWAQFWDNKLTYHHDSIAYLDTIAKEKGLKDGILDLPNLQFRAVNHTQNFNTHHAKNLITDVLVEMEDGSKKRKLTAFYGGLDLSRDRMDDWRHSFNKSPNNYGWRDVHQQVIGPVVADVLNDFASAWQNANNGRLRFWNKWTKDPDNYYSFERFCRNLKNTRLLNYHHMKQIQASWSSQFLRSTMAVSHLSFWATSKPYEKSIAIGYRDAILEAKHSIELESQYLIGGPGIHARPEHANFNPIPQALVDKIVERDALNVPFHVFITLPMLPNTQTSCPGELEMDSIRALQWLTMKWIMSSIEKHTGKPWWQYISFNFLAQWYGQTAEYNDLSKTPQITRNELVSAARRSPIYVHSKFLTVDNELMICGSANANERSMRGKGGDSELAILHCPEPGYEAQCRAQIISQRTHAYSVTLGKEFIKKYPECVVHPELFYNEIRAQALYNLEQFHLNNQSLESDPTSSPLTAWPLLCSPELGHVGEYLPQYPKLIDTPCDKEDDSYAWHPEHFSEPLHALGKMGIRLAY